MKILLKQSGNGLPVAVMEVGEVYVPDKPLETLKCYGTSKLEHPGEKEPGFFHRHHNGFRTTRTFWGIDHLE